MKLNLGDQKIYGSMDTVVFVTETPTYIMLWLELCCLGSNFISLCYKNTHYRT